MLKIDFDSWEDRPLKLIRLMFSLDRPYEIRISAGRQGLHVRGVCICSNSLMAECLNCSLYRIYDDPRRQKIHDQLVKRKLPYNFLFDSKRGRDCGKYTVIRTQEDIINFYEGIVSMEWSRGGR